MWSNNLRRPIYWESFDSGGCVSVGISMGYWASVEVVAERKGSHVKVHNAICFLFRMRWFCGTISVYTLIIYKCTRVALLLFIVIFAYRAKFLQILRPWILIGSPRITSEDQTRYVRVSSIKIDYGNDRNSDYYVEELSLVGTLKVQYLPYMEMFPLCLFINFVYCLLTGNVVITN